MVEGLYEKLEIFKKKGSKALDKKQI